MLEKKTTGEIIDSYLYLLKKDIVIDYSKVWVSQESINNLIEMYRQGKITKLQLLIELKGEKE